MQITVEIRDVYGRETYYPVSEEAEAFAKLAGTRTLTPGALEIIDNLLGYEIEFIRCRKPA